MHCLNCYLNSCEKSHVIIFNSLSYRNNCVDLKVSCSVRTCHIRRRVSNELHDCNVLFDLQSAARHAKVDRWIENIRCKMNTTEAELRTFLPDTEQLLLNVTAKVLGINHLILQ